jgi:hypothetical protein
MPSKSKKSRKMSTKSKKSTKPRGEMMERIMNDWSDFTPAKKKVLAVVSSQLGLGEITVCQIKKRLKLKKKSTKKRKRSSYINFYTATYQSMKRKYPTLRAPQIARKMGAVWRSMSDDEKAKWK